MAFVCACVCKMDSDAYLMIETASSLGIRRGTGQQYSSSSTTYVKLSRTTRESLEAKVRSNFLAAEIFPIATFIRNAVAALKIERQNFLGKIVAATEFPGDRISCDTGLVECVNERNPPV